MTPRVLSGFLCYLRVAYRVSPCRMGVLPFLTWEGKMRNSPEAPRQTGVIAEWPGGDSSGLCGGNMEIRMGKVHGFT